MSDVTPSPPLYKTEISGSVPSDCGSIPDEAPGIGRISAPLRDRSRKLDSVEDLDQFQGVEGTQEKYSFDTAFDFEGGTERHQENHQLYEEEDKNSKLNKKEKDAFSEKNEAKNDFSKINCAEEEASFRSEKDKLDLGYNEKKEDGANDAEMERLRDALVDILSENQQFRDDISVLEAKMKKMEEENENLKESLRSIEDPKPGSIDADIKSSLETGSVSERSQISFLENEQKMLNEMTAEQLRLKVIAQAVEIGFLREDMRAHNNKNHSHTGHKTGVLGG